MFKKHGKPCCADLGEAFVQVGKRAGNDATITVALGPSCNGEGLSAACLAIGEYGAIIASQHTAHTPTQQIQRSLFTKAFKVEAHT